MDQRSALTATQTSPTPLPQRRNRRPATVINSEASGAIETMRPSMLSCARVKFLAPFAGAFGLLALGACNPDSSSAGEANSEREILPPPKTIDEAVERRMEDAGLEPHIAEDTELCRRLYADLIGRFPTPEEIATSCAGQPLGVVAAELQSRPEYVVHGVRRWRDRLGTSDATLFWRDVLPAFDSVEAFLEGSMDYAEFSIRMMAEPALMAQDSDAVSRAARVHRAFLGADPSDAIVHDLARLTRIWDRRYANVGCFEVFAGAAYRPYVVPGHCSTLGGCTTELVPGGAIRFPQLESREFVPLRYDFLDDEEKASLRGLGEHVVAQPRFWEAAVDEALDRLLGWSDGGPVPQRPGLLLPEVRQLLVEHLRESKDVRELERLVVDSLLYRQTHRRIGVQDEDVSEGETEERPRWASGPLKSVAAETLLNTVRGTSAAEGSCDPRTADDQAFADIEGCLLNHGTFDEPERLKGLTESYDVALAELHAEQGNWRSLIEKELEDPENPGSMITVLGLDPSYQEQARAFGGCPGVLSPRLSARDGLAYAFGQETTAAQVCSSDSVRAWMPAEPSVAVAVESITRRVLSRAATAQEVAAFEDATCEQPGCLATDTFISGVCQAILGSHEALFY